VQAHGTEPWGGIAILGPATRGSLLRHVQIQDGSVPSWRKAAFGGMLNIQDSAEIVIEGSRFGDNVGQGDVVHIAYTGDLLVRDSSVHRAAADAWDIELSKGELRRISVRGSGDDGVDVMGSRLIVTDSTIVGCAGNGLSSGERSEVTLRSSLIANCDTGILAKNHSDVDASKSVIFSAKTGIRVYTRSVRYHGDSHVVGDELFVAATQRPVQRKDKKKDVLDRGSVRLNLPPAGSQQHLLHNVLELSDWSQLAPTFAQGQAPKPAAPPGGLP